MKKEVKALDVLLQKVEPNENLRAVVLVYLSVVILGKKFSEVSKYFGIPEVKVQDGVTRMAFRLRNSEKFHEQMRYVVKEFVKVDSLTIAA
jgi:hypothetical protein